MELSFEFGVLLVSKDRDEFYEEVVAFLDCEHIPHKSIDHTQFNSPIEFTCKSGKPIVMFTVVLGGDGTVLAAARQFVPSPLVVINTGHLGFLTSASKQDYQEKIKAMVAGCVFSTTRRHMLDVSITKRSACIRSFVALNDVVIAKNSLSKLVKVALYVHNGSKEELVCEYRADGLIVATPTGSTAYNLSAGGPIIHPSCRSFVVAPICPQGLTQRPLVLPPEYSLRLQPLENDLYVSIDGQEGYPIAADSFLTVKYNSHAIEIVNPSESYFQILRHKLKWGVRPV